MDKKIIIQRIDELMEEKRISKYALKENTEISSTIYQWRKNTARERLELHPYVLLKGCVNSWAYRYHTFLLLKKKNKKRLS